MIRINFWIIWAFKPNIRPNMIHSVGKKKREREQNLTSMATNKF